MKEENQSVLFEDTIESGIPESQVTEKHIIKARKELLKRFKRVDKTIELFCPHCHREFFIEP